MKMKKIFKLLLVISLVSGCSAANDQSNPVNDVLETDQYQTVKNYEYVENVEGFNSRKVDIDNRSEFKFDQKYTYVFFEDDEQIFYQELTNYVNLFQNMLDPKVKIFHFEANDQWKVEITDEDGNTSYVLFDFQQNTVTLSSFEALDAMFKDVTASEQVDTIEQQLYESENKVQIIEKSKPIVLDLSKYQIELKKVGDAYLVPSYLLQFVLSSYEDKLYYNGTSFDYFNLLLSEKSIKTNNKIAYTPALIDYATRFNMLIFDNFYGLKDYKPEYREQMQATNDTDEYATDFSNFVLGLDDKHTMVIDYGFGDYTDQPTVEEDEAIDQEIKYSEKVGCTGAELAIESEPLSEDTLYVAVNSLMDPQLADEYLQTVNSEATKNYDNIVLDLRCNNGGYVFNALVLLYPFTNEDVVANYSDLTGGEFKFTYTKKDKQAEVVKSKLYVLTSDLTFSAANEAALLFKENEIGTIIGEQSGGGAAPVSAYNSPSGAYMLMSGGMMLSTSEDGEITESGIPVDHQIDIQHDTYKQDVLEFVEQANS